MQSNTQSRGTGQPSDCLPVQVQDDDMNISPNSVNTGPISATPHGSNNQHQNLQQQQLQYLAECASASARANQQQQSQQHMCENQNGATSNPLNPSPLSGTIPPTFMMNFLLAASAMGFTSGGTGMNLPFPLATLELAAATASGMKSKPLLHTPGVFQHCRLRSGKWIEEEEKYAELLIELFEKGRIPRCENGSTLRSFLSQKLHCAPMRISKKYAGKGIGKMIYNDRNNVVMTVEAQAEHKKLEAKVLEAQERFHKAVVPNQYPKPPVMNGLGSFSAPHLLHGLLPTTTSQNQAPGAPQTPIAPLLSINTGMAPLFPPPVPRNSNTCLSTAASTNQKVVSSQEAAKSVLEESAKLLHQSFLDAFYRSDNSASNNGRTDGVGTTDDVQCSSTLQGRQEKKPFDHNQAASTRTDESKRPPELEGKYNYRSTLPDLLSTFDQGTSIPNQKHSGQLNPESFSQLKQSNFPPLTSRSFDELHPFLGSESSPDGNISGSSLSNRSASFQSPTITKDSTKLNFPEPTSNPLFTAESYAMFAVESAMAASQHDAYLPCSRIVVGTSKHQHDHVMRTNSIDNIDGVVKLLAEQSNRKERRPWMGNKERESNSYDSIKDEMKVVQQETVYYEKKTASKASSCEDPRYTTAYQASNTNSSYVTASERSSNPSTETESSSALESSRDSTNSENTEASASDGGSSFASFDSRRNEKRKRELTTPEMDSKILSGEAKRHRRGSSKNEEYSSSTNSSDVDEMA